MWAEAWRTLVGEESAGVRRSARSGATQDENNTGIKVSGDQKVKKKKQCGILTGEVVELMQRLHDDGDEWQIELSHMGSDLRLDVARV